MKRYNVPLTLLRWLCVFEKFSFNVTFFVFIVYMTKLFLDVFYFAHQFCFRGGTQKWSHLCFHTFIVYEQYCSLPPVCCYSPYTTWWWALHSIGTLQSKNFVLSVICVLQRCLTKTAKSRKTLWFDQLVEKSKFKVNVQLTRRDVAASSLWWL